MSKKRSNKRRQGKAEIQQEPKKYNPKKYEPQLPSDERDAEFRAEDSDVDFWEGEREDKVNNPPA